MRAIVCRRHGPPEDLELAELPEPSPGPGEVLVGVRAAAVNFPDALIIANAYQVSMAPPFVPGSELAGEVLAVGPGVTGFQPGDLVFGTAFHGAFAERVVLAAGQVTAMPGGVDFGAAAAFAVAYRTAYHAIRSVAEVRAGDWVVVLGAAGGVGLAAVDVARELGARVIAAASGPEKLALCARRGAAGVIDYSAEDLKARIRELTDGGAHAVIDPVGGAVSEQALRSVRWGGTFVTLGYAAGTIPRIPLNLVLLKGVTVKGMEIRTFGQHRPDLERRDNEELLALFAAGRLRPHIGARFPLEDAAAAVRYVADRRALGKVLIDVTDLPTRKTDLYAENMSHPGLTGQSPLVAEPSVLDLLDLERIEVDLYRSCLVMERPWALYGGQVAAQALFAAGSTVAAGRLPHSLHGYFLRSGSAARPTVFQVYRDRDGRSFSARRVVAIQEGEVIFNMSASFAEPRPGAEHDAGPMPEASGPDVMPAVDHPYHVSMETRPASGEQLGWRVPTRFWCRSSVPLPDDDLVHACVLTYMSDLSSGLIPLEGNGFETGPSLDHAVWFHRRPRLDDWVLIDLVTQTLAGGRGWYTGTFYGTDGTRLASMAQEALFPTAPPA